ncbi:hypothetical protein SAMN05444392_103233 [Seinonella peptonophila]|uniref:Cof subfamily of IIB subfamily of haloacid dehalogenase superfamily/HAD-superfamily hydrolase, subfamily IIB n=1 Tax=Seinonella peptonophila TaxID=112248 RepID=A0A1M4WID9_9BACL|nr:Cof-type HAD-IIB family hydrolase [Seinonella peptonophila]SHE80920.1 hypothetical protein SAMN05444392_103233 [Seinonella peptonophila]
MIKLFVTDLDHTLLDDDKDIHPRDRAAIDRLIDSGTEFAIATGRSEAEFQYIVDQLDHPCHRISQNGVYVRTAQGDELASAILPPLVTKQIIEEATGYNFQLYINVAEQTYTPYLSEEAKEYSSKMQLPVIEDRFIVEQLDESVLPCKFCFIGEKEPLLRFMQQLDHKDYRQHVDLFLSSPYCVDVVPKGISKGFGVQRLIDHLGISLSEVACVGDAYNDVPMFQIVSNSYAMRHADPGVQKEAVHVVDSVAEAVKQVLHENQAKKPTIM